MKEKILAFLGVVFIAWAAAFGAVGEPVSAAKNDSSFLGFVPWYYGLEMDGNAVASPTGTDAQSGTNKIASLIWRIIANVLIDLFTLVGYLAVGFIIYGGYTFITSDGEPAKAASAKKTLKNAIIGLILAILANAIIRTILKILEG